MKTNIYLEIVLLAMLIFPVIVYGQGILHGTIVDSTNKDPLVGVNVVVLGTSLGSATDLDGKYRVVGIPPGLYDVRVSYIGYEAKQVSIQISKEDISLNLDLSPGVVLGQAIEVYAQLRGQMAAINQQITSKTIVNVISEEKIQELPDANAAEAIGRLPGVSIIRSGGEATGVVLRGLSSKFSNINIDGVRMPATDANTRDVDLSTLSQGSLAGIELFKTLTPNQDADAIAGSINLVTRKAPSARLIRIDGKGDYNYLMKTAKNQYDVSARYGERFFDDLIGIQLQGNVERRIRSQENVRYGYGVYENYTKPDPYGESIYGGNDYKISNFNVLFNDELRTRKGGQAIIDINTPDSGTVKLSGMIGITGRNIATNQRSYPGFGTTAWTYTFEYTEQTINTSNTSLQGENYILGMTVNWNIAFAQSKITNPFDYRLLFTENNGGTTIDCQNHPEIFMIPFANNNFHNTSLDSSQYTKQENYEKENTYQLNLSKKFTLWNILVNDIKVGGKFKERTRWMNSGGTLWNNYPSTPFTNVDFTGTIFSGVTASPRLPVFLNTTQPRTRDLMNLYKMTPLIDANAIKEWYDLTQNGYISPLNEGIDGLRAIQDYGVKERISSAYIMNTMDLTNSLTLIYGVRVEKETNDYTGSFLATSLPGSPFGSLGGTGFVITVTQGTYIADTTTTYSETNWFPNIQLVFNPTDFLNLRLAAYGGIARPDYSFRLPKFSLLNGTTRTFYVGNPNLKNAIAMNYEASTQVYSGVIGLFTISGFYKVIDNMFQQLNSVALSWPNNPADYSGQTAVGNYNLDPNARKRLDNFLTQIGEGSWNNTPMFYNIAHYYSGYLLNTYYNSIDPTKVWGFELEHQFNFSFIPVSWLQNITLSYNLTIARSKTSIIVQNYVIDTIINISSTRTGIETRRMVSTGAVTQWVSKEAEDQPRLYGNTALGYDIAGFSARFSVFYQAKYVRSYSSNGTADSYSNEFVKCDLALKQQVTSYILLMLNINNIFDRRDQTSRNNIHYDWGYIPSSQSDYGTSVDLGVRILL